MWLLKLHFSISILCILTFFGIKNIWIDTIKANRYGDENIKKKRSYWLFFIPIINVLSVITLLLMAGMKKEDLEKKLEEMKNDSSDGK